MIKIRELQVKDAPFMIEWMHDSDIQKGFKRDMLSATLDDARQFCIDSTIPESIADGDNLHFAIVNENDEYLGTASLKGIDLKNKSAEYAISLRKKAQGQSVAFRTAFLILKKAFYEYGLHKIYNNVLSSNEKSIRYVERCGFSYEGEFREHINIDGKYINLKWYSILENEFDEKQFEIND